ncbi:BCD family MFS transporter [Albimonas sp. CAU 1670]|uniref:BCD family MFS transporter n=1 Tax=Albimonas sp. CAU 1670 TaxID=3032599 RepID=UPI0023DB16DB|nr:BCD family MFS transporter [Albimonas sp. CAU 1670]MDF2231518.1 BCD family MFS transporter [Albimonas sp. CAU 1670]
MTLGWLGIVRLGLVQMAIGSVVVLTTSTLNRVMAVELALPAALPGLLVGLHYAVQLSRPEWGRRSDAGGRRTPWILRGMAALAAGGTLAALAVALMAWSTGPGVVLAALAFALIGAGAGAAGTSMLALLASAVAPQRRAAAATITWLMMIAGIALTAGGVGAMLEPYSHARLVTVVAVATSAAFLLSALAVRGLERAPARPDPAQARPSLPLVLRQIWAEPPARRFTIFVFVSMVAYFMQELILEPYAGHVFGFSPGRSTTLAGMQNGGVFAGMVTVGIAVSGFRLGSLRLWTVGGCLASAAALIAVAAMGAQGPGAPLAPAVVALGFANGVFAVSAIGSMMQLVGEGRQGRDGARMGVWGAAQAVAAGVGGFAGAALVDLARLALPTPSAYGLVFLLEAALFLVAARLAMAAVAQARPAPVPAPLVPGE